MKPRNFFRMFEGGLRNLYRNPLLIVPSVLLGILLFIISKFGWKFAPSLQTTFSNVLWTAFVAIVSLVLISYFFAGLVGMAKQSIGGKAKFKDFTSKANKFWLKNFLIVLLIILISIIVGRIAHYGALFIGQALDFNVNTAVPVFVLIYFVGLIGILIFLTFSNVFLVVRDLSVWESMKSSMRFVRKEYLATLSFSVIFFIVYFLVNKIPGIFGDVVAYVFVVPFFVLILTRFVIKGE